MFYGKFLFLLLLLLLYMYIYKYKKIAVNPKWYIGINWYQNISFQQSNRYNLRHKIDSLVCWWYVAKLQL